MRIFVLAVLLVVLLCPPATAATLHVAPNGSGTTCSALAPCGTFQTATTTASPGDTILVAGGTYPGQNIGPDSSIVGPVTTFQPELGATVTLAGELDVQGVKDVLVQDMTVAGWASHTTDRLTLRRIKSANPSNVGAFMQDTVGLRAYDLEIGPVDPADGIQIWPPATGERHNSDLLFDGLWIHDLTYTQDPLYHQDAVQLVDGHGVTFSRVKGYNLGTQGFYSQCDFGNCDVDGVTVENSMLGRVQNGFYALHLRAQGQNFTIRNNTFTDPVYIQDVTGVTMTGNVFTPLSSTQCGFLSSRSTFTFNVIPEACGAGSSNKVASAIRSSLVSPDPSSSAGYDAHLKAGSPAIDMALPSFPAVDFDGNTRPSGASADAGADEFQAAVVAFVTDSFTEPTSSIFVSDSFS